MGTTSILLLSQAETACIETLMCEVLGIDRTYKLLRLPFNASSFETAKDLLMYQMSVEELQLVLRLLILQQSKMRYCTLTMQCHLQERMRQVQNESSQVT